MHVVKNKHAAFETKVYCVYMYIFQGMTQKALAELNGKGIGTINSWIKEYFDGTLREKSIKRQPRKFSCAERQWIIAYYNKNPTAFLEECVEEFNKCYLEKISVSSVWRILDQEGFTYKTVERRALQIKLSDVHRFCNEINLFNWTKAHLVFLDEVSFDNRGMLRPRGYALKGKMLIHPMVND
ncbi:hypothetical protein HK103_006214 [Boothiomyces macroporosus]|uniref:Transposase n=1 Tax=Boothiomyces macroporosus TaxID=261099 RepID=A0AAD5U8T8_9FUNG|nr:hypothetical protein HK103_003284 [Boothiomyces macroporosus]KAJ3251194.1 hypothetical protein HK103_002594 [Boothiomyces macroporosus]KAJ3255489.1 hypothetical protein HK103_006214 [Boothiomyces macroporosus]